MLPRSLFFVLLTGLCLAGTAAAQAHGPWPGAQARFERLSLEQGLSQSSVVALVQDRDGFLWLGTQDGLNRYDGYTFRVYRHDPFDDTSLPANLVQVIRETRDGTLWAGTLGGGLARFDRATEAFTAYRYDPDDPTSFGDPDNIVEALHEAEDGALWVGTSYGLHRFDPATETFTRFYADPDDPATLADNYIWSITSGAGGTLWVGTLDGGLHRVRPEGDGFRIERIPDALLTSTINVLAYRTRDGTLWVGTAEGLNRLDPGSETFRPYYHDAADPGTLPADAILSLYEDAAGTLWVGTEGGLCRMDPATGVVVRYQHNPADPTSLSKDLVRAIYEDRSGTLWVGTDGGGLNKHPRLTERFGHYKHDPLDPQSLSYNYVWALHEDAAGHIWVGTDGGGLNQFDPASGTFRTYRHDPGNQNSLSADIVLALADTPDGSLWVGSYAGGLDRLNPTTGRFEHFGFNADQPDDPRALSHPVVSALWAEADGTVWVGTYGGGLDRLDPQTQTFTRFAHDPRQPGSLNNDVVTTLYQDRRGTLWVGTYSGGLNRLDPGTDQFVAYRHDPDRSGTLGHNTIYDVVADAQGTLWVATAGGGLARLDARADTFHTYTTRDGLPHNIVYGLLTDAAGHLWASTNAGLTRFDPPTEMFTNYDVSDGLQSNEFNSGAALRTKGGEMYFGGINGFNRFDPGAMAPNPHIPAIVLTDFRKFDASVDLGQALTTLDRLELSHRDNFISFEFAALDFVDPLGNQYAYRLRGVDRGWRYTDGTRRTASYTNLGGGTYTFEVKGANSDGIWNETPRTLTIRVVPPVWKREWFLGLLGLGAVLLVVGGVRAWYRGIEREQAEARETQRRLADSREAERLVLARDLHDGVVQDLYGVGFQLDTLAQNLPGEARNRAEALRETLRGAIGSLRDLCKDLRPPLLGQFGLAKALRAHAAKLEETHPTLTITCDLDADGQALPERQRLALYRIYQEALQNILRHADATHATVRLALDGATVTLEVTDDGQGFVVPERLVELARQDHLGLVGAVERAEAIGGRLTVTSQPGTGTTLRVVAPVGQAAPVKRRDEDTKRREEKATVQNEV